MIPLDALASRWPELNSLLDDALALPVAERAGWLESLIGARAEFRETLLELLAAQAGVETRDFMGTLPKLAYLGSADAVDNEPTSGDTVGPYRLISELGRGGMGAVWLAERTDAQIKRRVALKLPRLAWGGALAERLARERDILASLAHPNIARLYDAGVDQHGRPYLAMEHVEGRFIDVYCRDLELPLRERLALLLQVCGAVAHAHTRLVVHRDLKPGNILVTTEGQVRLLDFGVAKLLEGDLTAETSLTQRAGRALTLDYASPEQIRGEPLGTASDVYSLAVVAFELLAGARPYRLKRASAAELEEAIASIDPALASDTARDPIWRKQLKGDLDAILNKALKKDSSQRYVSVDAMAQDFHRYLNQQPVQAQPDRFCYRAGKFVSRYRLQVLAGAAVVVSLVMGVGAASWQAREARMQADRARAEAATAKAVQGFIEAVFRATTADRSDPQAGFDRPARRLLDLGADRIDTELHNAPLARLRLLRLLASMYEDLYLNDKVLELLRKRLALAREATAADSDETVVALADLAQALENLGQRGEAGDLLAQATTILDARTDLDSPARLRVDMVRASLGRHADPADGLLAAERAVRNARRGSAWSELMQALQLLGENALRLGQPERAEAALNEAVRWTRADPIVSVNRLGSIHSTLGDAQQALGKPEEALASYRQGQELVRRLGGVPFAVHLAEMRLGNFLFERGRLRESLDALKPAADWARSAKSGFGADVPMMLMAHGRALVAYGRVGEGLVALDEAQAFLARLEPPAESMASLGALRAQGLIEQGRYAEADQAIARAQSLAESDRTGQAVLVAGVRRSLQLATGQASQALRDFQAAPRPGATRGAMQAQEQALAESAALHLATGLCEQAAVHAGQALSIAIERPFGGEPRPTGARATMVLGLALLRQGSAVRALPVLERALELHRTVYDPDHSLALADALLALAEGQHAAGDAAAAARSTVEARRIHARHPRVGEHRLAALRRPLPTDAAGACRSGP